MDNVSDGDSANALDASGQGTEDLVATRGYRMLPVVALGCSAGGIDALAAFLAGVRPPTGHAFVVIQHLSPNHESLLAELLRRQTTMEVLQVTESAPWKPDTVYVIPPRKALESTDGRIGLTELPRTKQRHYAVDLFFRTLADTHGPHAVAVVLSGADSDGAIGIKRIKERGGLTIAQEPGEAAEAGMPRAAIATGMVDWVLPAADMAARIIAYRTQESSTRLPPETGPDAEAAESAEAAGPAGPAGSSAPAGSAVAPHAPDDESTFRELQSLLKSRTGKDLTYYKRATILRRIQRRMQVNGIDTLADYLRWIRTHSGETGALMQDLLISVTNFYRDPACFEALEKHVPDLFAGRGPNDTLRVWVAACATGEEAYSVAMLLLDHARTLEAPPVIQIFATDLDEEAIRKAREGLYPESIEVDVPRERLRRYFVKEAGGYRVRRELRECILFAVHDVLRDSPFSRVQLITCRNLLIYLSRVSQRRVIETFHFALRRPAALLLLGVSEAVDESSALFAEVDKRHRLYAKREPAGSMLPIPSGRGSLPNLLGLSGPGNDLVLAHGQAFSGLPAGDGQRAVDARPAAPAWGEIHLRLLERLAPPSILIDREHDILHLSENAGRYLHFAAGEPSRNLIRLLHPALRAQVHAAVAQAFAGADSIAIPPVALGPGGSPGAVSIRIHRHAQPLPGLALVVFEETGAAPADPDAAGDRVMPTLPEPLVDQLERELERLRLHLRDTVEQYEASTEELRASNEELQAMNEELRSATEELETSREELQSINEELITVNHELKGKVDELASANGDLRNLMDATAIATIFLDRQLCITRFTPSAIGLFSLIDSDIGRPLSDLHSHLRYPALVADANQVLDSLGAVEREIEAESGRHFLVRIRPYRSLDERIGGVVLTFVDITERKASDAALRASEARFSAIVNQAPVGVVQCDLKGIITYCNENYCEMLGRHAADIIGVSYLDFVHPDDREQIVGRMDLLIRRGQSFEVEKRLRRPDGSPVWVHDNVSLLSGRDGRPSGALTVCTDVGERRAAEQALRTSEERLRLMVENAVEYAILTMDLDGRVTAWNSGAQRLLGYPEGEILGQPVDLIFTDEDRRAGVPREELAKAIECGIASDERLHRRKDGSHFWASGAMMPMRDGADGVVGLVKILRDQSDERSARKALEASQAEMMGVLAENQKAREALEAASQEKDRFLAVLSHELRNPLASVVNASEVLAQSIGGAAHGSHAVDIIRRQAAAMSVMLGDLLDLSRLRLGRLELHRRRVPLADVVSAALETVRPLIDSGRHRLDVTLPGEAVVIDVDPLRLSQVISNLVSNAVKYTPAGGRITVTAALADQALTVAVADNGIGMDPQQVASMFEMFAQGPPPAQSVGGLGIGLALVRSIVTLHGGTVEGFSDGPGKGSRFMITLPRASIADAGGTDTAPAAAPARPALPPQTILIADDNEDVLWPLQTLLQREGHSVIAAHGGLQALELARRHRPSVVILDIGMPDLDGREVARRIRAAPWGQDSLLIALTGWGQEADRLSATNAGFDEHLVKPVEFSRLLDCLAKARPRPS